MRSRAHPTNRVSPIRPLTRGFDKTRQSRSTRRRSPTPQYEQQEHSLRYDLWCHCRSSFDLEWATQRYQSTVSSWTEEITFVGKCPRCPQGNSSLADIRYSSEKVQYVPAHPLFPQHPCSTSSSKDSEVIYLRLFAQDFVVLNSSQAVSDLIEKRSDIYSGRVSPGASHAKWC